MNLNREYLEHERQIRSKILNFARSYPDIEAICTKGMRSGYLKGKYVFLTCCFQDYEKQDFERLEKGINEIMTWLSLDFCVLPFGSSYSENFRRTIYRNIF